MMESASIVVICAVVFGVVTALSAFIRQILLSRDKRLNEEAQQRAFALEASELKHLRVQMESGRRFDSHYQVLGSNRDAIHYLDQKIEDILERKFALIQRYADAVLKQSSAVIAGRSGSERKAVCDLLKEEIDREIQFYDNELKQLQERRASIWDARHDLQEHLLQQETARNQKLDILYQRHTELLEKIYMRQNETMERIAVHTINAGTESAKLTMMAPIRFLMQYFRPAKNISLEKSTAEKQARQEVVEAEQQINGASEHDNVTEQEEVDSEASSSSLAMS